MPTAHQPLFRGLNPQERAERTSLAHLTYILGAKMGNTQDKSARGMALQRRARRKKRRHRKGACELLRQRLEFLCEQDSSH